MYVLRTTLLNKFEYEYSACSKIHIIYTVIYHTYSFSWNDFIHAYTFVYFVLIAVEVLNNVFSSYIAIYA